MAFGTGIITSLFGRRVGLQQMSSAQTGTGQTGRKTEYLVGPDALRMGVETGTTGTYLMPHGVSLVNGTSAGSSCVYRMDPPIPGVKKFLTATSSANGNTYISASTDGSVVIVTTWCSSFCTIKTTGTFALELIGLTTAIWGAPTLTSGTSSNASGFNLSTTT